jgi:hypothetical protein
LEISTLGGGAGGFVVVVDVIVDLCRGRRVSAAE